MINQIQSKMNEDQMMEIHKIQNDNHARTRELQWKFNITLWTFMAAAIYFVNENTFKIPACWKLVIVFAFIAAGALYAILTQKSLAGSRAIGNDVVKHFGDKEPYSLNMEDVAAKAKIDGKGRAWIAFQIFVTVALGIILYFVMELN